MTLPRKLRVVAREIAIETAGHASELELAESIALEVDIGGLDHVQVVGIPKAHLDDPPLADHRALCPAPHVVPPEAWEPKQPLRSSTGRSRISGAPLRARSGSCGPRKPVCVRCALHRIRDD